MSNPLAQLAHSRKFLVLLLDTVVSIILYFGSKYVGEAYFADIKFLIGALQAPVLMIIYAIAAEDSALIRAQPFAPGSSQTQPQPVGPWHRAKV